ncbi:hybrid sensor histidine kinase/response regulator [Geomonas agri]|uniref:hybrid sensor histidine kinase/response regulator n=1 Tax=Geomonas agri TaxID=2873702 RepID=UPI001CD23345|nr:PAS domain-containing sensor histidine kinase [Geomonas agri]
MPVYDQERAGGHPGRPLIQNQTVRIVVIYAIFGLAWIYGSDHIIDLLIDDKGMLLQIAVAKGFVFILCTATLLYILINRLLGQLAAADRGRLENLENLSQKNAQLRLFFESAPASLAMFDRDMRYMEVSRRWLSMYGLGERDIIGLSHYEVFPEIPEYWKECHRRGLAGETLREEAEEFRRADGSLQYVRWEIRPWYQAAGEVGGIVIFTEDITERKRFETALEANERFLRLLTDHLPGLVGYWNGDLTCGFANRPYRDWFGKNNDEIIGSTMRALLGEELFLQNEPHVRAVLAGEPQHFQRTLVKRDGETAYVWSHYIPDLVEGSVHGFYVLVSDVTELKRAETERQRLEHQLQQAQKMESVGRLAGGIAHDFNNLLTVIMGLAQLGMRELGAGHPTLVRLEGIQHAAEKSAALTSQLLGFARKQTIAPRALNLNGAVEEMLKMLKRLVGEDIDLAWNPGRDLWKVCMDPSQLDQILANLCVNARDAITDIGKITIETGNVSFDAEYCNAHFDFVPGEYVLLAVSDDGCGMDRETMAQIFEPFFSTKEIGRGTGLGLATVYGIVKQNNGFINTYSELGEGTTFKIYLPRHTEEGARPLPEAAPAPCHGGSETILLVEDEASILNVAVSLLTLQGYQVLPAAKPGDALELAQQHRDRIDLVITDVVMPDMNGRELVRRLLPFCPKVKCLYMSGYTANVIAHHGVLDQGVNFISKPFTMNDLAAKVRAVLDAKGEAVD